MDGTGYVEKRSLGDKVKGALGVGGHRHTAGTGYGTGYKLILFAISTKRYATGFYCFCT
jgi:hypothetical protein